LHDSLEVKEYRVKAKLQDRAYVCLYLSVYLYIYTQFASFLVQAVLGQMAREHDYYQHTHMYIHRMCIRMYVFARVRVIYKLSKFNESPRFL